MVMKMPLKNCLKKFCFDCQSSKTNTRSSSTRAYRIDHPLHVEMHSRHELCQDKQQGPYHENRLQGIGAHNRAHTADGGNRADEQHHRQSRGPKG